MAFFLTSCGGGGNGMPNPEITGIQPDSGPPGTLVTISGKGFSAEKTSNAITIGGEAAPVESATESQLKTKVPKGASSGPVKVTVGGETVSGPQFTVEAKAPGISSIKPDSGIVGTEVTIEGMNFSTNSSDITITFNGTAAPVNDASKDRLITKVPDNASDGPVKVTVKQKSATGPDFDVLAPTIIAMEPDTAVIGATIAIKGKYFAKKSSKNKISFGGIMADVDSVSSDTLYTVVPEGVSGGPVKVVVGEQISDGVPLQVITNIQACYGNDVQLDANLQWVSQGLTTSDKDDKSQDMAMDSNGNLYMVLRDRGVAAKYDTEGDKVWESRFDSKLKSTTWRGIEVDGNSVYIVGERGVTNQGLGEAKLKYHFSTLKDGNSNTGGRDVVLARLDAGSGSLEWAQQFGSPDLDELNHETIAVLPSGEILVSARMSGPFTPKNKEPNKGSHDVAIAKFQKNGTLQTVKQIEAYTAPYSIAADDQSRIFLGARNDNGNTIFARLNSNLQIEASSKQLTRQIKQPIPMPDGGAVVYGNTATSLEPDVNVYIKDAYVQRLGPSGVEQWVHQQKFDDSGSTKYNGGVRIPGGGVVLVGQNASEIGGLPYLGVYADEGMPLFIDGSKKSTFFEFENDKKGRGFPSAVETYRDANNKVHVFTMGVTTSSWPGRSDDDNIDPKGGKDMWITGMTLKCEQQ
ncbi:IPT/TIG domain-containing protein [Fodinibius saliphilus]|uniref:IPT/TIG domain-containing protein n=1 Tax=Fodinibius saliphilus TaxID=1920650 RepID=UPI001486C42C|nr:IPT/TIG domain-containing protein [Fodinibius saliphilus]